MAPTDTLLESLSSALGSSSAGVEALSDEELCEHLDSVEQLGRLVDALRVSAAAEVDVRSRRELGDASLSRQHGCQTGSALVEQITRVSAGEAGRRVRVGRALASRTTLTGEVLPAEFALVAESLTSGRMGVDAAAAVVRYLTEASRTATVEQLQIAEAHLVVTAESETADFVAVQARAWRERLDPDGAEPREEELRRQRRFVLGRERNGLTPFSGLADPVNAALLRAAIAERTAPTRMPRFLDVRDLDADELGADE
ncbi:MAG: 13E12 repeat family protein, partial [Actinomycetota bacterium]|nr:13E12 repeat family protein [Actinomycetota bacterium]